MQISKKKKKKGWWWWKGTQLEIGRMRVRDAECSLASQKEREHRGEREIVRGGSERELKGRQEY